MSLCRAEVDSTVYMSSGRWNDWAEVAGFFPQETWEVDRATEQAVTQLARQDETVKIHGSCCSITPEEEAEVTVRSIKPNRHTVRARELVAQFGFKYEQALFFLKKKEEFAQQEKALEEAQIEAREKRRAQRPSPYNWEEIKANLVPLQEEPATVPDVDLLRARKKQARMDRRAAKEREAVAKLQKILEDMKAAQTVFKTADLVQST